MTIITNSSTFRKGGAKPFAQLFIKVDVKSKSFAQLF